jgi:hypothetical protein
MSGIQARDADIGLSEIANAPSAVQAKGTRRPRYRSAPIRLLMLATSSLLPYRVMRCAQRCGAEVYVLGDPAAQLLATSRYCKEYIQSNWVISGAYDEDLALEINCRARELGIVMLLPGDAPSTRALIACRHLLERPCFPLPDLEQFDLLNDKWRFVQLCDQLGVRHPATCLIPDADALEREVSAGRLAFPLVLKAKGLSGGQGLIELRDDGIRTQLGRISYRPIIVQQFIPGRDIGASIYCRAGKIIAFIAHEYRQRIYSTFWNEAIYHDIERIAAYVGVDGVYNFDMIAAENGDIYYLECNPRFFFKIDWSMMAGINFVALGLTDDGESKAVLVSNGTKVRSPEAMLASPREWFRLTRKDWASMRYAFSDPVPLLMHHLGWPTTTGF